MLAFATWANAAGVEIRGIAQIIDGDSIKIGRDEIRLFGVDAPEWKQDCVRNGKLWKAGRDAASWLKRQIEGKEISCAPHDKDRYGRWIATCINGAGDDIGRALVSNGWAYAYDRYSTRYIDDEKTAWENGTGVWTGECELPWEWRLK